MDIEEMLNFEKNDDSGNNETEISKISFENILVNFSEEIKERLNVNIIKDLTIPINYLSLYIHNNYEEDEARKEEKDLYLKILNLFEDEFQIEVIDKDFLLLDKLKNIVKHLYYFFVIDYKKNIIDFLYKYILLHKDEIIENFDVDEDDIEVIALQKKISPNDLIIINNIIDIVSDIIDENKYDYSNLINFTTKNSEEVNKIIIKKIFDSNIIVVKDNEGLFDNILTSKIIIELKNMYIKGALHDKDTTK